MNDGLSSRKIQQCQHMHHTARGNHSQTTSSHFEQVIHFVVCLLGVVTTDWPSSPFVDLVALLAEQII